MPEIAAGGAALYDPNSEVELAALIRATLDDPGFCLQLAESSRRRGVEIHDWNHVGNEVFSLLSETSSMQSGKHQQQSPSEILR